MTPTHIGAVAQWLRIHLNFRSHRRLRFNPWVGKIPWRRTCQPSPYSCLENAMDREPWWDTVPVFTESDMTEATERACTPTYGRGAIYFAAFNVTITPKQPHKIPSVLAPWAQSSWHIKLNIRPGVWASQSRLQPAAFLKAKRLFPFSINRVNFLPISHLTDP